MQIQVPAGTAPNAVLQVRAPDGRTIKVRVPPNVRPGQQMRIAVPPAAAPKATKPAAVPANQSRGRLPVAGLVGKSFGLYQKDEKAWLALDEARSFAIKNGSWAGWDTARFVAFDAGKNRVALRNPGTERWLRVTADGVTDAPARGNWNATWGWERFELHELAGGVGLRSASGRWLTIGGKRTIQLEPRPVRKSKFHDGACSMAWRCRFLTARPSQDGRVVSAPDTLVDFHTGRSGPGTRTSARRRTRRSWRKRWSAPRPPTAPRRSAGRKSSPRSGRG